ncbi:hypothetical protein HanIR_Chr02g0074811 [Helianthus annuus]|nr:hypothetical protein HanIR_Chr02g0074811 [Helianthus annuus]
MVLLSKCEKTKFLPICKPTTWEKKLVDEKCFKEILNNLLNKVTQQNVKPISNPINK